MTSHTPISSYGPHHPTQILSELKLIKRKLQPAGQQQPEAAAVHTLGPEFDLKNHGGKNRLSVFL